MTKGSFLCHYSQPQAHVLLFNEGKGLSARHLSSMTHVRSLDIDGGMQQRREIKQVH